MNTNHHIPRDVQADINATRAMIEQHIHDEEAAEHTVDEHYDRIIETLMQVSDRMDEEAKASDRYIFNQAEFVAALDHVVADQLSALKKEKISPAQWAERFNRWFVFCDAVCNLGISCMYTQAALKNTDYETVFKTLKLNKTFETAFLKPRKIRVELTHKSKEVKEKYSWLAMPCLIITDEQGVEHQIAITPSPNARVWWLDVLAGFHGSYSWIQADADEDIEFEDEVPLTSLEQSPQLLPEAQEAIQQHIWDASQEKPETVQYVEQKRLSPAEIEQITQEHEANGGSPAGANQVYEPTPPVAKPVKQSILSWLWDKVKVVFR